VKPVVKLGITLGAFIVLVGLAVVSAMGFVLVTGPRMRTQPNVRTYQAEVTPLPEGVVTAARIMDRDTGDVPDASRAGIVRVAKDAATMANPVPADEDSCARGKIYYQYYCIFCHGEQGDGNGPVGQSYVPKPADLRTPKVQGYSDGQILVTMLTGEGHEPVLERVAPPEHRWYLVHYVRTLGSAASRRTE